MIDYLLALLISLHSLDNWKEKVYEEKYNQAVQEYKDTQKIQKMVGNISWYAKGKNKDGTPFDPTGLTAACWDSFKKGTQFRVSFNGSSIDVICTDRGYFEHMGRLLDLSAGAFKQLAPLSTGIIRGAEIEVLP